MNDASTRSTRIQTKSARRRAEQKETLRRAILDAAGELFLEHGYEHFSLRAVAEHIGYSPTTIYLYFEDKEALLFEVAQGGFTRFGEMLQAAYDSIHDPLDKIDALGAAYMRFGLDHPAHYRLMFMQRGDFLLRQRPNDQRPTIDSFGVIVRAVQEALDAHLIDPALGNALSIAQGLWAGVHGMVALTLCLPIRSPEDEAQRLKTISKLLRDGYKVRR